MSVTLSFPTLLPALLASGCSLSILSAYSLSQSKLVLIKTQVAEQLILLLISNHYQLLEK